MANLNGAQGWSVCTTLKNGTQWKIEYRTGPGDDPGEQARLQSAIASGLRLSGFNDVKAYVIVASSIEVHDEEE